jgi:transcriptional regulator with XRE-family HTH domain
MNLDKLKEIRLKKGMTQIDVAVKVGVSMTSYINWEKRANNPSEENLQKLKEVLGVKE